MKQFTNMKGNKVVFHTFNKKRSMANDEATLFSTNTCLRCNMNCNLNTKLVVITVVMLTYSVPLIQGNGLPFGPIERTPPRENCTGEACVEQQAAVQIRRIHRLDSIKKAIFAKLGLKHKPNITEMPPKAAIDTAVRKVLERSNPKSDSAFPGGYFAEVSEIVSFAEEVLAPNVSLDDGIQFTLHRERPDAGLRVVNANLYVLVRYKKKQKVKGVKNKSRRVRINILNAPLHKSEPDLITTLDVYVKHTRWQQLILPTSVIQDVLDSEDKVLRLRIVCNSCGSDVNPVLVKRRPPNRKVRPASSRRSSRRSRKKSRTQRRAPPLQGLQQLRTPTGGKDASNFGDVRDKVKQQRKVHKRRPFLVIHTRVSNHDDAPMRKRSIKCNKLGTGACSMKSFHVDFRELGWDDWILFPSGYNANYCAGQCDDMTAPRSLKAHHSTILDSLMSTFHASKEVRARERGYCCSPTKYSPLSILYLDGFNIVKADIPNMKVEECGCA